MFDPKPLTEREKDVMFHWNSGKSAAWVANRLGLSRNTVIGVVHRIRLKGHPMREKAPTKEPAPPKTPAPKSSTQAEKLINPRVKAVKNRYVTLEPLKLGKIYASHEPRPITELNTDECRYAVADRLFCGHSVKPNTSWCEEHYKRIYVKPERRIT